MQRIVSVWFPEYPVECFIRGRKKTGLASTKAAEPFALVESGAKGLRLAACSRAARNVGLRRGQRLADARAMVPALVSEIHEPHKDAESLAGLARWSERYSPWVSLDPPDGLLLDIAGCAHLFDGEAALLADLRGRLAAYGFTAIPAAAGTVGAAWALARYGEPMAGKSDEDLLRPLPIEALRIAPDAAQTLRRLGLKTIGDLIVLPRSSLAKRFRGETIPENVLIRLDEALGVRDEPLSPISAPSRFFARQVMMEPVISAEGLDAALVRLVEALAGDLERAAQGAIRMVLRLFRSDGSRIAIPAGLTAPSHDAGHLLRLLRPKLETVDAGFGIDAMALDARETADIEQQQEGFREEAAGRGLAYLADRVMNRHDGSILGTLVPAESHIPERAESFSPSLSSPIAREMASKAPKGARRAARISPPGASRHLPCKGEEQERTTFSLAVRPLLIFDTPEPTVVIALVPDGPPQRFTWRRVLRTVVRAAGPERIAPEWWRLHMADNQPRDYYTVEDDAGRRYWLYREGLYDEGKPRWFVHGLSA